jgi:hypothetical protein
MGALMSEPKFIKMIQDIQKEWFLPDMTLQQWVDLPGVCITPKEIDDARATYEKCRSSDPIRIGARFVQHRFAEAKTKKTTPWVIRPDMDDVIWGAKFDVDVVGQRLNLGDLPEAAAVMLIALAHRRHFGRSESETEIEAHLLMHTSRSIRNPPADFDVQGSVNPDGSVNLESPEKTSKEFIALGSKKVIERSLELAHRFSRSWKTVTGGETSFFFSNKLKGSMHVDMRIPPEVEGIDFYDVMNSLKMDAAVDAELPLHSQCKGIPRPEWPAVVIDDTIWHREVHTRGGVWRPPFGAKRKNGKPTSRKVYIPDLNHPMTTWDKREQYFRIEKGRVVQLVPHPRPASAETIFARAAEMWWE